MSNHINLRVQNNDINQTVADIKQEPTDIEMERFHSNINIQLLEGIKQENIVRDVEMSDQSMGSDVIEEETGAAFKSTHANPPSDSALPAIANVQSIRREAPDMPDFSKLFDFGSTTINITRSKRPEKLLRNLLANPKEMGMNSGSTFINQNTSNPIKKKGAVSMKSDSIKNTPVQTPATSSKTKNHSSTGNQNLKMEFSIAESENLARNRFKLDVKKTVVRSDGHKQNLSSNNINSNKQQQIPGNNGIIPTQGNIRKLVSIRPANKLPIHSSQLAIPSTQSLTSPNQSPIRPANKLPVPILTSQLELDVPSTQSLSSPNQLLPIRPALHVQHPGIVQLPLPVVRQLNVQKSTIQGNTIQLQTSLPEYDGKWHTDGEHNKDQNDIPIPTCIVQNVSNLQQFCNATITAQSKGGLKRKKSQTNIQPWKKLKKIPMTKTAITLDLTDGGSICIECDQSLSSVYHSVLKKCDLCSFSSICSVAICCHLELKHGLKLVIPKELGKSYAFLAEGLYQQWMKCQCEEFETRNRNEMALHLSKCTSGQRTCRLIRNWPNFREVQTDLPEMYIKSEILDEDIDDNPASGESVTELSPENDSQGDRHLGTVKKQLQEDSQYDIVSVPVKQENDSQEDKCLGTITQGEDSHDNVSVTVKQENDSQEDKLLGTVTQEEDSQDDIASVTVKQEIDNHQNETENATFNEEPLEVVTGVTVRQHNSHKERIEKSTLNWFPGDIVSGNVPSIPFWPSKVFNNTNQATNVEKPVKRKTKECSTVTKQVDEKRKQNKEPDDVPLCLEVFQGDQEVDTEISDDDENDHIYENETGDPMTNDNTCVCCSNMLHPNDSLRKVNEVLSKYLQRKYQITTTDESIICNNCHRGFTQDCLLKYLNKQLQQEEKNLDSQNQFTQNVTMVTGQDGVTVKQEDSVSAFTQDCLYQTDTIQNVAMETGQQEIPVKQEEESILTFTQDFLLKYLNTGQPAEEKNKLDSLNQIDTMQNVAMETGKKEVKQEESETESTQQDSIFRLNSVGIDTEPVLEYPDKGQPSQDHAFQNISNINNLLQGDTYHDFQNIQEEDINNLPREDIHNLPQEDIHHDTIIKGQEEHEVTVSGSTDAENLDYKPSSECLDDSIVDFVSNRETGLDHLSQVITPPTAKRSYLCVCCSKRVKRKYRRKIGEKMSNYIQEEYLMNVPENSVICCTCRSRAQRDMRSLKLPPSDMRKYKCICCLKSVNPTQRLKVDEETSKYIHEIYLLNVPTDSVICSNCLTNVRRRIKVKRQTTKIETNNDSQSKSRQKLINEEQQDTCTEQQDTCTTKQKEETDLNKSVTKVSTPPNITTKYKNYIVYHYQTVTLRCNITSDHPITLIRWLKYNKGDFSVIKSGIKSNKYSNVSPECPSLTIYSVGQTDEGRYICEASNIAGSSQSQPITVQSANTLPCLEVEKNLYTVKRGDHVTLKCNISSINDIESVSWEKYTSKRTVIIKPPPHSLKYSHITRDNPSLTIYNVDTTDSCTYRCSVINAFGQFTSQLVTVKLVQQKEPVLRVQKKKYIVNPYNPVTLKCDINSDRPMSSVWWERRSNDVTVVITPNYDGAKYSSFDVTNPTLTILEVNQYDEGIYTCFVENADGEKYQSLALAVEINKQTVPVVTMKKTTYEVLAKDERNVTLECSITSCNPVLSVWWLKIDPDFTTIINSKPGKYSDVSAVNPSLTIYDVDVTDGGMYVCFANNIDGQSRGCAVMLEVNSPEIPVVKIVKDQYIVNQCCPVFIECEVSSDIPVSKVSWWRHVNGILKSVNPRRCFGKFTCYPRQTRIKASLSINKTDLMDTGTYLCKAISEAGEGYSDPIHLKVIKQDIAVVTMEKLEYKVKAGMTLTLQCSGNSDRPISSVYWTKSIGDVASIIDTKSRPEKYKIISPTEPSLTIYNVDMYDIGIYRCYVNNGRKESCSSDVKVNVTSDLPIVTTKKLKYDVPIGETVTLQCRIISDSHVSLIKWLKCNDNGIVEPVDTVKILTKTLRVDCYQWMSSIIIQDVDPTLAGKYYCIASNDIGEFYSSKMIVSVIENNHQKNHPTTVTESVCEDLSEDKNAVGTESVSGDLNEDENAVVIEIGAQRVPNYQGITAKDMEKIYNYVSSDQENAQILQYKVYIDVMFHFGREIGSGLCMIDLKKNDFAMAESSDGRPFVYLTTNRIPRVALKIKKYLNIIDDKMYAVLGHDRCPVNSLMKYIRRLHPRCVQLFQQPRKCPKNGVHYNNVSLSKAKMRNLMLEICKNAGLTTTFYRHGFWSCKHTPVDIYNAVLLRMKDSNQTEKEPQHSKKSILQGLKYRLTKSNQNSGTKSIDTSLEIPLKTGSDNSQNSSLEVPLKTGSDNSQSQDYVLTDIIGSCVESVNIDIKTESNEERFGDVGSDDQQSQDNVQTKKSKKTSNLDWDNSENLHSRTENSQSVENAGTEQIETLWDLDSDNSEKLGVRKKKKR